MNDKFLIGYVCDANLPFVTEEQAKQLTHINIAFGLVKGNVISISHLKELKFLDTIRSYNPNIKILLSVGGWGAGGFSEMAATEEGRKSFTDSAIEILKQHKLNGIDLDWEYPGYGEADIASSYDDKKNFTLLNKCLRENMDKQYMLTVAVGADQYFIDETEMDEVQKYLDYVQLMTYDMRGGFQTLSGHHTNLYTSRGDLFRISTQVSVDMYVKAGVPKEKIVIGVAFYSRRWENVPNQNNGLHQMSTGSGKGFKGYFDLQNECIDKNGFTRYWDDIAKAPYLFDGSNFVSYDDPESLSYKCKYLKETGLQGVMFWEHGCDKSGTLLKALYDGLHTK